MKKKRKKIHEQSAIVSNFFIWETKIKMEIQIQTLIFLFAGPETSVLFLSFHFCLKERFGNYSRKVFGQLICFLAS